MASKRRDIILQTAMQLFNEQGASNVTTNHIAAAMEISPGSLYYHFRNKEQIIAALVEQMVTDWDMIYEIDVASFQLEDLRNMQRHNLALQWKYRFFYREVPLLLSKDPALKERYFAIRDARVQQQVALAHALAAAGRWKLPEPQELERLFNISWMLGDSWLAFQELEADWDIENYQIHLERGVEHLLTLYRPYFIAD